MVFGVETKAVCSRVGVFIVQLIALAFLVALFAVSVMQMKSHEKTSLNRALLGDCKGDNWSAHSPFRFSPCFSGICDPEYLMCPWPTSRTTFRLIFTMMGAVILLGLTVCMVLNKKIGCCSHRMLSYTIITGNITMALLAFVSMCMDADKVRTSASWCKNGLSNVTWKPVQPSGFKCDYNGYIVTCVLDAVVFVVFALATFVFIKYVRSDMFGVIGSPSGSAPLKADSAPPAAVASSSSSRSSFSSKPVSRPMEPPRSSSSSRAPPPAAGRDQRGFSAVLMNDGLDP